MDQAPVPQQPNLKAIQQALQMIANGVSLLNNHPAVNQMGAFQQMLNAMEERIIARIDLHHQISHARSLNSSALAETSQLHRIALPNGNIPVDFPGTIAVFKALTGPQLSDWIQRYSIMPAEDIPSQIDEKRQVLSRHWSIPQ